MWSLVSFDPIFTVCELTLKLLEPPWNLETEKCKKMGTPQSSLDLDLDFARHISVFDPL